ncbi:Rieske 2Fe-2S domain-containing protein [Paenibacillus sp. LMG 31456]|uniref:Rieske 2Fe-2S domain-containing protein n=1 Tax=Paenibacillus foliorum TaxID=2654974 RepID=A0A972GS86_9BACL|nr:Rieske (2Fe-2S) protein [Paenibacillus foliorum]NOU95787.1 Rieske 2Fe-2S domain-containing protein [Paenibacillus foliorum]
MSSAEWVLAGTLEELKTSGSKVIKGGIAVFYHEDKVAAVDNRCPHLGFPLHLGSVCNGVLTCHWHHARFDVCSGGTLDPWADDVPAYDIKIEGNEVWVNAKSRNTDTIEKLKRRLQEGLEQNIGIVIAKAVVGLVESGVPADAIVRIGIEFGTSQGTGWGSGLTILTAMRSVLSKLDKPGQILALYHGLVHVARASSGRAPRHLLGPMPTAGAHADRLLEWYRSCVEVRDTQGAEKVLLTAISNGVPIERLAEMMLISVTDHFYLDGGHTFDFHNKAFEALEYTGADSVERILASLVPLVGDPARSEELHHWQAPVDLVSPLRQAFERIQKQKQRDISEQEDLLDEEAFVELVLSDRPIETVERIVELIVAGEAPVRLARLITVAAAERIVRFHTQNDFRDWVAVLHTFTYAHAVHERLHRSQETLLNRALFYGAMAVYHDRFLNVPRANRPKISDKEETDGRGGGGSPEELLGLLDQRQQVNEAASWVAEYLRAKGSPEVLLNTLGHCLLREDAEFHTFQMYEAAVAEYGHWETRSDAFAEYAKETILLACTRYLAAHAPTARELPHTAKIAWRLYRGERLFEEE